MVVFAPHSGTPAGRGTRTFSQSSSTFFSELRPCSRYVKAWMSRVRQKLTRPTHIVFLLQIHSLPVFIHLQLILLRDALHFGAMIVVTSLSEFLQRIGAEDDQAEEWQAKVDEWPALQSGLDGLLERRRIERLRSKNGHVDGLDQMRTASSSMMQEKGRRTT